MHKINLPQSLMERRGNLHFHDNLDSRTTALIAAPTASDNHRWKTLWYYMQSGPGIFKGDLHFGRRSCRT
jgi:hypothetical protein